ncbi:cbb3-type cytochrome oxidase assembly protein CcoS [Arenimonas composti]|uniref:Cytochrome oxidase maturation protein Cbb3 n=1 Tax=Arenimonas composti TR7-09 = DSM 18010 TaxID=1121013 RepID=A0A091BH04_9GAMM|nr:cbb3-type cytochrome oxidase assembly protein CcoS [Arenimonas composti]KFN51021.1 hypothetical protein P873_04555 [Arenimonas composti TR7-09 = DSM 18010]
MNILLALIPVSILLLGAAIWAFLWAVRRGQFDDLDTPALDILRRDDAPAQPRRGDDAASNGRAATDESTEPPR